MGRKYSIFALVIYSSGMNVLRYTKDNGIRVADNVERRYIHGENLMSVVVDFSNGPASEPDPFHSHVHEQTTYVAEGEVLFFIEGEEPERLKAGDLVAIPSGKPHAIQMLSKSARLIDNFNPIREDFLL